MNRIKEIKINQSNLQKDIFEIECFLNFKNNVTILDRNLTTNSIIIKYDKEKELKPIVTITTLKGPVLYGFNLKTKHIKEIIELLEQNETEEMNKIGKILKTIYKGV